MRTSFMTSLALLVPLSGLLIFNGQVGGVPTGEEQKTRTSDDINLGSRVLIAGDNAEGGPLLIQEANVIQISEQEFKSLTGEDKNRPTTAVTFPDVNLLNTSTKTIKSFGLVVHNAIDNRKHVIIKRRVSIGPGEQYKVASREWSPAERRTVREGDRSVTRLEKLGIHSPKSWISAAATDLRVIVALVDFDDGTRWTTSQ